MKLNRTPNPLDRSARNGENDNWDIIEGEVRAIGDRVDNFIDETSDTALGKVVDNAKLNWKEPVDSFEHLPISANKGDTRMVRDTGKVYRFDGGSWLEIQQIDAGPVNELDSRLSSQLAETVQELDSLDNKKADKETMSNSLNILKNQKVDEVTFDIATQEIKFFANGILIDSVDVTEASNAQLVQDYIDSLVENNEIQGVTLADGTVTKEKLADHSITNEKLDKNVMTKTPWLKAEEDDLDYIWGAGNYMVGGTVKNNPFGTTALMSVERGKTTDSSGLVWVKQTITQIVSNRELITKYRAMQLSETNNTINFKKDWQEIDAPEIPQNPHTTLFRVEGVNVAKNVFNKDSTDKREGGIYSTKGVWNDTLTDYDSYKIKVDYLDVFTLGRSSLTIVGFDENGNITENFSSKEQFQVQDKNTDHFYYPIPRNRVDDYDRMVIKGSFYPAKKLEYGKTQTYIEGLASEFINYQNMKWVAMGTSMTSRGEYTDYVAGELGLNLDNRGVGSGGITSYAGNSNTTMQAVENVEDFKGIVSIELGPNDWNQCPLGELGDTDDTTWYGAVDKVCRTITKRTSARPFFITSTTSAFNTSQHFDESQRRSVYHENSLGFKYIDYVNAVKEVAQHYSIPVCDVFGESGLGYYHQNNQTLSDWIHLSDLGGEIYGNHIINFLKYKFTPFPNNYENPLVNI